MTPEVFQKEVIEMLTLIAHLGSIVKLESSIQKLVQDAVKNKGLPNKTDWMPLVEAIEDLLVGGVIKIPGSSPQDISVAFDELKKQIQVLTA